MECKKGNSRWEPGQNASKAPDSLTPGQRNVSFGKYLWRVLDVQNNRALLLAEEILEQRRYHSECTSITWEACDLRKYLNGAFLQTFSSQEQERIVQTENRNADNQWFGTSGGRDTVDKVFLLSIEEVVKYFGDSGDLRARKGWYWESGRPVLKDGKGYWINDEYNGARIAKYRGEEGWWWLRSPGYDGDSDAARVDYDGNLYMIGDDVINVFGGVRPALWLNPES